MKYLRVKNYDLYQPHKFKNPPYVHLYGKFWHDEKCYPLSRDAKLLFCALLTLTSWDDGALVLAEPEYIRGRMLLGTGPIPIDDLIDAGLIEIVERDAPPPTPTKTERERQRVQRWREKKPAPAISECPVPSAAVIKPSNDDGKTRLPDGWGPDHDQALAAYAAERGLDVRATWAKFKEHAIRKNYRVKSWKQAWETWCRNDAARLDRPPQRAPIAPPPDPIEAAQHEADAGFRRRQSQASSIFADVVRAIAAKPLRTAAVEDVRESEPPPTYDDPAHDGEFTE